MKKLLPILTVSLTSLLAVSGLIMSANNGLFKLDAADSYVKHSIILTYEDMIDINEESGTFGFYQENATYCQDDFMTYDDAFVYGNTMSLGKNGHIFDIEGTPKANSEIAADALFTIYFEFLNVAEYSSVVLTGSFNSKDNGTSTTLIYHSGDFVDDKITIDEYGLYSATLDKITISYKCVA